MQLGCKRIIKDIVNQGAFAGTGNTCHNSQNTQWENNINIFQVIGTRAFDSQEIAVSLTAFFRYRNKFSAAQILPRNRFAVFLDFFHSSLSHNMPAIFTGAWSNINNLISRVHCFFIMFDNQQSIAQVTQVLQGFQQFTVVTLVQTNARFIENIENADQA